MIGTLITDIVKKLVTFKENIVFQKYKHDNAIVQRYTIDKFTHDKPFFKNDDKIILLDEIIYNKLDLMSIYSSKKFN